MKIPVEISARHIHLSPADLNKLFGENFKLEKAKTLSQTGEFASAETVTLVTKKGSLKLSVLGPTRGQTQAEISRTDCNTLGIKPVFKISGDIKGAPGGQIVGPAGLVKLKKGIIIAKRHIHCDEKNAKKLNLKNGQTASVKIAGERGLIFNNVIARVSPKFKLAMHIDTDEANAAGINKKITGELVI